MRCTHCHQERPARGYCCEKSELEALRAVVDEVSRHLASEVTACQSIGALDVVETIEHARARLHTARRVA
jgi:hypothetical protein